MLQRSPLMLKGKSILVTGGTGSFGKKFIETILRDHPGIERLVIYSRDELKQFEMEQVFSVDRHPQLRYFIGDVRDKDRLMRAMEGMAAKQAKPCSTLISRTSEMLLPL